MKLFRGPKFENLEDLLLEQIEDLYDAEKRLCNALPRMAEAASNARLSRAFTDHLEQTRRHVQRLERVFSLFGHEPQREACDAMKGLIAEGEDVIKAKGSDEVRDAALIAAAQRVEHYEIAGYGTARALATRLGRPEPASLFQETLEEERAADLTLTEIAESFVNPQAARA